MGLRDEVRLTLTEKQLDTVAELARRESDLNPEDNELKRLADQLDGQRSGGRTEESPTVTPNDNPNDSNADNWSEDKKGGSKFDDAKKSDEIV